jgi:hypothetical protein
MQGERGSRHRVIFGVGVREIDDWLIVVIIAQ